MLFGQQHSPRSLKEGGDYCYDEATFKPSAWSIKLAEGDDPCEEALDSAILGSYSALRHPVSKWTGAFLLQVLLQSTATLMDDMFVEEFKDFRPGEQYGITLGSAPLIVLGLQVDSATMEDPDDFCYEAMEEAARRNCESRAEADEVTDALVPRPVILLCDVKSVALVKATQQDPRSEFHVKRYPLRKPGKEERAFDWGHDVVEVVFRDLMSCLIELVAHYG